MSFPVRRLSLRPFAIRTVPGVTTPVQDRTILADLEERGLVQQNTAPDALPETPARKSKDEKPGFVASLFSSKKDSGKKRNSAHDANNAVDHADVTVVKRIIEFSP